MDFNTIRMVNDSRLKKNPGERWAMARSRDFSVSACFFGYFSYAKKGTEK